MVAVIVLIVTMIGAVIADPPHYATEASTPPSAAADRATPPAEPVDDDQASSQR